MLAATLNPLMVLSRRRLQLTVRTPRELLVPLVTPLLFALVIAPALKTALLGVGMYGLAEILAARVPKQEEYIARVPAVAIVPWFLAGSLFPISAMPTVLTWAAKFLPLTHALAVMRYGLLGDTVGLHHIWGSVDPAAAAPSTGATRINGSLRRLLSGS